MPWNDAKTGIMPAVKGGQPAERGGENIAAQSFCFDSLYSVPSIVFNSLDYCQLLCLLGYLDQSNWSLHRPLYTGGDIRVPANPSPHLDLGHRLLYGHLLYILPVKYAPYTVLLDIG